MNKILIVIFFLLLFSSCIRSTESPLKTLSKNNFKHLKNENVKLIRKYQYKFCNKTYLIYPTIKYNYDNLINYAIIKFKEKYYLKENEYITNFKISFGGASFWLFYSTACYDVKFDLMKKL